MVSRKICCFFSSFTLSLALVSNISSASGTGHYFRGGCYWSILQQAGGNAEGQQINLNRGDIKQSNVTDPGLPNFTDPTTTLHTVVKGRNLTLRCSVRGITSQHTVSSYISVKLSSFLLSRLPGSEQTMELSSV